MNLELKITIITAVIGGMRWLYEYIKQRKWEKNKFLLEQIEKFQSIESTQVIEKLLDWNSIGLEIKGTYYKINDDILTKHKE